MAHPKSIPTDCKREFISQDTQAYLCSKEIKHTTTTPYHPQANGRMEHLNGIVLTALRKLAQENASSWVKYLPTALLMARSRVNRDINFSPFEMVYGYKPDIQDLHKGLQLVEPDDVPRGNGISPKLKNICNLASEQGAKRVCEQVIKQTDLFEINNEVWALNPEKRKLKPKMIGHILQSQSTMTLKPNWYRTRTERRKTYTWTPFGLSKLGSIINHLNQHL